MFISGDLDPSLAPSLDPTRDLHSNLRGSNITLATFFEIQTAFLNFDNLSDVVLTQSDVVQSDVIQLDVIYLGTERCSADQMASAVATGPQNGTFKMTDEFCLSTTIGLFQRPKSCDCDSL